MIVIYIETEDPKNQIKIKFENYQPSYINFLLKGTTIIKSLKYSYRIKFFVRLRLDDWKTLSTAFFTRNLN